MYKLGCYGNNGEPEVLRIAKTREEAKEKYKILKRDYNCTIWIQKIDFVNPKDLQTRARWSHCAGFDSQRCPLYPGPQGEGEKEKDEFI